MAKGICKNCEFIIDSIDKKAYCRRYPPVSFMENGNFMSAWPKIKIPELAWCGEFKLKENNVVKH
jgi:hypothetical protein